MLSGGRGFYWSSSIGNVDFDSKSVYVFEEESYARHSGYSVRPVAE